jgi:hypothetical protein
LRILGILMVVLSLASCTGDRLRQSAVEQPQAAYATALTRIARGLTEAAYLRPSLAMRADQANVHVPGAAVHASVVICPSTGVGTSAHAI